jgi:transcriptional regulator GlxA family with amidase domain
MAYACTLLVLEGVADSAVGITLDVLGAAKRIADLGLAVSAPSAPRLPRILSLDGNPVRTGAGRMLAVDGAFTMRGVGQRRVVIVPGLGMATPEEIQASLDSTRVRAAVAAIAAAGARGATIAASCSATFLLGAAGVLDGREATTTWWLGPEFSRRFPRVTLRADRMVVASGPILTAGSAFAHVDLMLALVARMGGPSLANLVSRYLVIDERPSQSRYMVTQHLRTDDATVRAVERFVLLRMDRPVTLKEMARAAATSPRTLARKFADTLGTTPLAFARRLRVERAVHLLETTRASVDRIAAQVGYADPAAFRRVVRQETGRTPREFRRSPP